MAGIAELQQLAQQLGLAHIASGKVDLGNETLSNTDYLKQIFEAEVQARETKPWIVGVNPATFHIVCSPPASSIEASNGRLSSWNNWTGLKAQRTSPLSAAVTQAKPHWLSAWASRH